MPGKIAVTVFRATRIPVIPIFPYFLNSSKNCSFNDFAIDLTSFLLRIPTTLLLFYLPHFTALGKVTRLYGQF